MNGWVHSVQSMSAVDGPGVRAVVFFAGCPLRCVYCHNPDTWQPDRGTEYNAQTLFEKIHRFRAYFGENGGVTVSGGEPLLQADFLAEFFTLCKNAGVHTCLDTAGSLLPKNIRQLLSVTDLCLLDLKFATEADYQKYTGGSLTQTLQFFDLLREMQVSTVTRHVIVPGINDNAEYLDAINKILSRYPNCIRHDLLPFRKLCVSKYEAANIPFPLQNSPEATEESIQELYRAAGWR